MKQNRYNYYGRPIGASLSQELRIDALKNTPTAKQRKFLAFLEHTLTEKGVTLYDETNKKPKTRGDYADTIQRFVILCDEHGIETRAKRTDFERNITFDPNRPFGLIPVTESLRPVTDDKSVK